MCTEALGANIGVRLNDLFGFGVKQDEGRRVMPLPWEKSDFSVKLNHIETVCPTSKRETLVMTDILYKYITVLLATLIKKHSIKYSNPSVCLCCSSFLLFIIKNIFKEDFFRRDVKAFHTPNLLLRYWFWFKSGELERTLNLKCLRLTQKLVRLKAKAETQTWMVQWCQKKKCV